MDEGWLEMTPLVRGALALGDFATEIQTDVTALCEW